MSNSNYTTYKVKRTNNIINNNVVTDANAIISVNTHGEIQLKENNTPYLFKIPNNVNLIIVSAVVPGVCNYTDRTDIDIYNKIILDAINITPPSELINDVLPELNKVLYKTYLDATKKRKRDDIDMSQYFLKTTKTARVSKYKGGDTVVDKFFTRNKDELIYDSQDYRIPILNIAGQPDIMDNINYATDTGEISMIYLSYIVKYCIDLGMNNIVIFDFSCSSFPTKTKNLNLRDVRSLRRTVSKFGVGGRKNKKTNRRQNKNRKTIKRSLKLKTKTRSKK
jgi:hypothetical protein